MPLKIPDGVVAVPVQDRDLLTGPRTTDFRYDVVINRGGPREDYLGELKGVQPGGSLSWTNAASIKGSGSLTILDLGQNIDWLRIRICPVALITGPNGDTVEEPLGVFIPSAPAEDWTNLGRTLTVSLLDKCAVLDEDAVADAITGEAPTYSLPAGTNVIEAVRTVIEGAGESTVAITPDTVTLSGPMTWEAGTSRLKVINDLLDAAGYFSLWVDEEGQFQCTPYVAPADRAPRFLDLRPFDSGPTSVVSPEWTKDVDLYSVPNRVIAVQQGDGDAPGLIATVENTNPDSPFSYQARGRWIVRKYDGVEAASQAALTAYAQRMLSTLTNPAAGATISHLLIPGLRVNDVIQFSSANPRGMQGLCAVAKTSISLDPLGMCSSEIQEILPT